MGGSHSKIGIFTLCVYTLYFLMGLGVFVCGSATAKTSYHQTHLALGQFCVILGLWTVALGVMWEEYDGGYDSDYDEYARSRSGVVLGSILLIVGMIVGGLFYARTLLPK